MTTLCLQDWTPSKSSWKEKAPSKARRVRELLSDHYWHSQQEMQGAGGMRFGARLHSLHVGEEGEVLHYRKSHDNEDDARVLYQQVDEALCDICSNPKHERPSQVIERQAKLIARLKERIVELERGA